MVFMMEHDISFKSPTGSHDDNNVYSDRRVHVADETRSACETASVDDGDRPRQWKRNREELVSFSIPVDKED